MSDLDARYKIDRFCSETGGNVVLHRAGLESSRRIYTDIQNELRSQYILGFYPPADVKAGGKWRRVDVQTSRGEGEDDSRVLPVSAYARNLHSLVSVSGATSAQLAKRSCRGPDSRGP